MAPQDLPLVADEYLQDLQNPEQLRDQFLDLLRDAVFLAPSILTARHHRGQLLLELLLSSLSKI